MRLIISQYYLPLQSSPSHDIYTQSCGNTMLQMASLHSLPSLVSPACSPLSCTVHPTLSALLSVVCSVWNFSCVAEFGDMKTKQLTLLSRPCTRQLCRFYEGCSNFQNVMARQIVVRNVEKPSISASSCLGPSYQYFVHKLLQL